MIPFRGHPVAKSEQSEYRKFLFVFRRRLLIFGQPLPVRLDQIIH